MKDNRVTIQISEEEWLAFPKDKREMLKEMIMDQYGWDIEALIVLDDGDALSCPYCDDKGCGVCLEDFEGEE